MDIIKIVGIGIVAVIIITIIKQYKPEFAIYVSIIAGIIIFFMVFDQLSGIINLINELTSKANINSDFIKILLKITGIAFLAEFAVQICMDLGESALANKVDLGGKVIIISLYTNSTLKEFANEKTNNNICYSDLYFWYKYFYSRYRR